MREEHHLASNNKQVDAASYDIAAVEFDRLSERFCGPVAMGLLDLAQLRAADQALDVGSGTGLVALRAASAVRHGRVIGIDHSPGMLEQATRKALQSGLADVATFRVMDAERLEFPDQTFDVVLSLYALFHFPQPLVAIREMYRVLRPGGRLVIGVGAGPDLFSWSAVAEAARRTLELGAVARGRLLVAPRFLTHLMTEHGMAPEEKHLPKSPRTPIPRMLRDVGFHNVHQRWQGHCEQLDAEDFWRVQATYATPERIRLQHATSDEIAALKKDFLDRCGGVLANNGRLIYRHAAMFYVGTRA